VPLTKSNRVRLSPSRTEYAFHQAEPTAPITKSNRVPVTKLNQVRLSPSRTECLSPSRTECTFIQAEPVHLSPSQTK